MNYLVEKAYREIEEAKRHLGEAADDPEAIERYILWKDVGKYLHQERGIW